MLTGLQLDGAELYRLGVVEDCVPVSDLMDVAMALAKEIAAKSPPAVVLAKHALNAIENMSLRDGYRFEQTMTVRLAGQKTLQRPQGRFFKKKESQSLKALNRKQKTELTVRFLDHSLDFFLHQLVNQLRQVFV